MECFMPDLTLWLVRHGETEVNSGVFSVNPNETRLTAKGIEQAQQGAAKVIARPDLFIISPLLRAQQTGQFYLKKWPQSDVLILPIQEFLYLSPQKLEALSPEERKREINDYWLRADPSYCDSIETESFALFLARVAAFHEELLKHKGYVVSIGHGQFFKAFLLGLEYGFNLTSHWMSKYRQQESTMPINNGEIIKLAL